MLTVPLEASASLPPCPVVVGIGGDLLSVVSRLLERTEPMVQGGPDESWAIVLSETKNTESVEAAQLVRRTIEVGGRARAIRVLRPLPLIRQFNHRYRSDWVSVPSVDRDAADRGVPIDHRVAAARRRWLICPLPGTVGGISPMAGLTRFAAPRQRLATRLAPANTGLVAEIAGTIGPSAVLMMGTVGGHPTVVSTADLLAAELVWLALSRLEHADDSEPIGPWEDATVQRATELGSRLRLPSQLSFALVCSDPLARSCDELGATVQQIGRILGVPMRELDSDV